MTMQELEMVLRTDKIIPLFVIIANDNYETIDRFYLQSNELVPTKYMNCEVKEIFIASDDKSIQIALKESV